MDLHSRHPKIVEQDFLKLDLEENHRLWEAISLSLVLNFVPSHSDRGKHFSSAVVKYTDFDFAGRMLRMAHGFLRDDGLLFLAVRF
jgi:25S rRNA (adenine2142-N1)-methyltransferase